MHVGGSAIHPALLLVLLANMIATQTKVCGLTPSVKAHP
jgi:hypothetical protein